MALTEIVQILAYQNEMCRLYRNTTTPQLMNLKGSQESVKNPLIMLQTKYQINPTYTG